MIVRPPLPPGPFLVVGLARSGVAAALALRARGEAVVGCDAGAVAPEAHAALDAAGVEVVQETDGLDLVARTGTVVKSPGVPREAPAIAAATAAGIPVIGELELGWRLTGLDFIAVTGSNGKTTTVELLGHIHRAAGLPVAVVGNVGTPVSGLPGSQAETERATVVCEASSFQLEDAVAFAPEVAVLLNLAEDHLDRHGTFEAYRAAKLRAFALQPPGAVAVVPADLPLPDLTGAGERVTFGAAGEGREPDLADRDGALRWRGERVLGVDDIRLRGPHNRLNAMAAAAAALAHGVPLEGVRDGVRTFAGVAHRLEEVAVVDGVTYVNDSKATNVASAVVGIGSFPGGVHAILGGRGKGGDYAPLAAQVAQRASAAYLIGEAAPEIREALAGAGVPLHDSGDLEHAVAAARAAARPGDVVLLSPACASYDQYRSFEERGEHFRSLARR